MTEWLAIALLIALGVFNYFYQERQFRLLREEMRLEMQRIHHQFCYRNGIDPYEETVGSYPTLGTKRPGTEGKIVGIRP